jgi:small subunit ribosomal protein S8
MSMSDPLGDMLTRIRNAQRSNHTSCVAPGSRLRANVLDVLKREGQPVIKEITRISRPGRRVYSKIKELPRVYSGLGVSILSTPRGVMSDQEARAANVGGEVLCRVF